MTALHVKTPPRDLFGFGGTRVKTSLRGNIWQVIFEPCLVAGFHRCSQRFRVLGISECVSGLFAHGFTLQAVPS